MSSGRKFLQMICWNYPLDIRSEPLWEHYLEYRMQAGWCGLSWLLPIYEVFCQRMVGYTKYPWNPLPPHPDLSPLIPSQNASPRPEGDSRGCGLTWAQTRSDPLPPVHGPAGPPPGPATGQGGFAAFQRAPGGPSGPPSSVYQSSPPWK
jgi:hypothetical protein